MVTGAAILALPAGSRFAFRSAYAGLYIQRDRVWAAVCRNERKAGVDGADVVFGNPWVQEYLVDHWDADGAKQSIKRAIRDVLAQARTIVGFGVGCYGPYLSLDPDHDLYGRLHLTRTDLPFRGLDLPELVRSTFASYGRDAPPIMVHTDANVCALGEASFYNIGANDCLVYLLLTHGVGGGHVTGRRPATNALHPEVGLTEIAMWKDDRMKDAGQEKPYRNSLTDLVSIPAMMRRAQTLGHDPQTLEELLNLQQNEMWPVAARYVAEAALSSLAWLAPMKVVIGGPGAGSPGFVQEVRTAFGRFLNARLDGPLLEYPALATPDFITGPSSDKALPNFAAGVLHLAMVASTARSGRKIEA